jgi:uncharacterized protein (DUF885 family)
MKKILIVVFVLINAFLHVACSHAKITPSKSIDQSKVQAKPKSALIQLTDEYVQETLKIDPFGSPSFGYEKFYAEFGDNLSEEYFVRSKELTQSFLKRLHAMDVKSMSEIDQDTYKIFENGLKLTLRGFDFPSQEIPIDQMDNQFRAFVKQGNGERYPFKTLKNYEDFLKRAHGFKAWVDSAIMQMRKGVKHQVVLNHDIAVTVTKQLDDYVVDDILKSDFYKPLLNFPKEISAVDQAGLKVKYEAMIRQDIIPQFRALRDFFKNEYTPKTRKTFGLTGLPHAKAWYQYSIQAQTDVNWSPQKIHQIGLDEVARIRKSMELAKQEIGFKGSYKEFLKYLTGDQFYFKSQKEVVDAFAGLKAKVDKEIPKYFSRVPKLDYQIMEIPANEASQQSAAYYRPHDEASGPAVFINSANLKALPIWELTTLSMHEAVPGHHFQIEIQYEMKDILSEYRVNAMGSTAFVEGWALYCESLGNDFGFYKDPLQRIGNLNDDMLRSVRLVVDTGIHSQGWSKARAVQYMRENLANDLSDIEAEVYRYSSWPGQALAYKIGQRKILELRALSQSKLGSRFDIRKFHNIVIGSGTLPLWLLETKVKNWISQEVRK